MRKFTIVLIGCILLALFLSGCQSDEQVTADEQVEEDTSVIVELEEEPVEPEPAIVEEVVPRQIEPESVTAFEMHLMDIGMGDSALIKTQRGTNILYNCGRVEDADEIIDYLNRQGVTKIHALIVSHDSSEVVGGCAEIMKEFEIGAVYTNGKSGDSREYGLFEYRAIKTGMTRVNGAQRIVLDEDLVTIFYTAFEKGGTQMRHVWDESLVLWIGYDDVSFLLPGHCRGGCEKRLMKIEEDLEADVLWVGDHGHRDGTTYDFIDAVKPQIALISVGKESNPLRVPHEETLERLHEKSIRVYRTDTSGSIVITTDGKEIQIETERADRPEKEEVIRPVVDIRTCPYVGERGHEDFYDAICPQVARMNPSARECFLSREAAMSRGKVEAEC